MDNKYTNTDIFKSTECPSDALLLRYVKDKISREDKRLVELHLVDCEMCNDMIEGYQRMEPANMDMHIKTVEQRIDNVVNEAAKKGKPAVQFKWYYAAAAVLMLALTGIVYQFYFSSLNETKVADLPKPHEHATAPLVESEPAGNETLTVSAPTAEIIKFTKPVATQETEQLKITEQENVSVASAAEEAPVPVQAEAKADAVEDVVVLAEPATKALNDMNTVRIANTDAATAPQGFTSPGATTIIAQPTTTNFNAAPAHTETLNLSQLEGKNVVYNWKETTEKNAKFKAKSPAATAKKSESKDKAETDSEKAAGAAAPDLLTEGLSLLKQKQYTSAIQKFNAHLTTHPNDCAALQGLSTSYEFINQQAQAILNYIKLTELKCGKISDEAYLKLAALYLKNNQPEAAKTALQKAKASTYSDIAKQAQKELDKL